MNTAVTNTRYKDDEQYMVPLQGCAGVREGHDEGDVRPLPHRSWVKTLPCLMNVCHVFITMEKTLGRSQVSSATKSSMQQP